MTNKISIIVPVYDHLDSLKENIISLIGEMNNCHFDADIYYVNDHGPNHDMLKSEIMKLIDGYSNFQYTENAENLGFLKSVNNAVFNVVDKKSDILLLNSDTKVTTGFLDELVSVLYDRDDIACVCPRSNNATVFSIPMSGKYAEKASYSYELFRNHSGELPKYYISPTVNGFCMLIRRSVIDEYGLFDDIYGKGYAEENDFCMRISRHGWKCAVSNRSFVFHLGSASFTKKKREKFVSINEEILLARYPEYYSLVADYVDAHHNECFENHVSIKKASFTAKRLLKYMTDYGLLSTVLAIAKVAKSKLSKSSYLPIKKHDHIDNDTIFHIYAHQISHTGASAVLINFLDKLVHKEPNIAKKIVLSVPLIKSNEIVESLKERTKINIEKISGLPSFQANTIPFINTIGFPKEFFHNLIRCIENGFFPHLYIYIHEEFPGMFLDDKIRNQFSKYLIDGRLTIYCVSEQSVNNCVAYFGTNAGISKMQFPLDIERSSARVIGSEEFNSINFVVSGSFVDGRKNQQMILFAFIAFFNQSFLQSEDVYRDFSLTFIGSDDTFYSNTVVDCGRTNLGMRFSVVPHSSADIARKIIRSCNFTISMSQSETLGISNYEGMLYGHPIIRSQTAGMKEQLIDGENGYFVSFKDFSSLVNCIEKILNKSKTSNKMLSDMSEKSVEIALTAIDHEFYAIDEIILKLAPPFPWNKHKEL